MLHTTAAKCRSAMHPVDPQEVHHPGTGTLWTHCWQSTTQLNRKPASKSQPATHISKVSRPLPTKLMSLDAIVKQMGVCRGLRHTCAAPQQQTTATDAHKLRHKAASTCFLAAYFTYRCSVTPAAHDHPRFRPSSAIACWRLCTHPRVRCHALKGCQKSYKHTLKLLYGHHRRRPLPYPPATYLPVHVLLPLPSAR